MRSPVKEQLSARTRCVKLWNCNFYHARSHDRNCASVFFFVFKLWSATKELATKKEFAAATAPGVSEEFTVFARSENVGILVK